MEGELDFENPWLTESGEVPRYPRTAMRYGISSPEQFSLVEPALEQLEGDLSPLQNLSMTPNRVRGDLETALGAVVRRNESLRTVITVEHGQPMARTDITETFTLPRVDLRHLNQAEATQEADRLTAAQAASPFDLEVGPLYRFTLVQVGPLSHRLLVTVHHHRCPSLARFHNADTCRLSHRRSEVIDHKPALSIPIGV